MRIPETVQQYYDTAVCNILDGTWPAIVTNNKTLTPICMYRTPDGRGCAAGILLPDDLYDPAYEESLVKNNGMAEFLQIPEGMTLEDVYECQDIHDSISVGVLFGKYVAIQRLNTIFNDRIIPLEGTYSASLRSPSTKMPLTNGPAAGAK